MFNSHMRQVAIGMLRLRWFAPAAHGFLFATTCIIALAQGKPLLDGPARWGFIFLFFADFPISLVGFSAIWDGRRLYGILLWGIIGTAWWYPIGVWMHGIIGSQGKRVG
jgi:hypothetical protein